MEEGVKSTNEEAKSNPKVRDAELTTTFNHTRKTVSQLHADRGAHW